ncbi:MAG: hypothetical protein WBP85_03530 [Terracidiphilus sp.]
MTGLELLLWAALAIVFWRKGLHRRFPAMGYYLVLRAVSAPLLLVVLFGLSHAESPSRYLLLSKVYSIDFFAAYLSAAILLFFVCVEVFRSALAPFPGIAKLAVVIFRWAAFVSVIVSLSSVSFTHPNLRTAVAVLYNLMHAVSLLTLCLLAFLCISMNALRLSVRDHAFGIALGLGIMSSGDFILASLGSHIKTLNDPVEFVYEGLILLSLAIWGTYSLLPEPARKPILIPASSTIYRWNEIASALGHGTRVAVQQPANGFFLSDVERVVEKVLAKNMKDRESET